MPNPYWRRSSFLARPPPPGSGALQVASQLLTHWVCNLQMALHPVLVDGLDAKPTWMRGRFGHDASRNVADDGV